MSLDVRLLEKVRELASGILQARCPACAEGGSDRAGEHLRLYPDGRFGCCVHPKDREHRKRIFALAGDKATRSFRVKVVSGKSAMAPAKSVVSSLTNFRGTLGTAIPESVSSGKQASQASQDSAGESPCLQSKYFGTLGTPLLNPYTYAREEEQFMGDDTHICKGSENGVPSVPRFQTAARLPYLTPGGTLVIPFDSPERFHWWKGGQFLVETMAQVESWRREAAGKEQHGVGV